MLMETHHLPCSDVQDECEKLGQVKKVLIFDVSSLEQVTCRLNIYREERERE